MAILETDPLREDSTPAPEGDSNHALRQSVAPRVRAEFERGGNLSAVRSDVRKRKALDWLLERVEIVDEDGQPIDRADLEIGPDSDSPPAAGAADDPADDDQTETTKNDDTESDTR